MPSYTSFKVVHLESLVRKRIPDQEAIDEVTCLIIYDLIANFVIVPAQRVDKLAISEE